MNAKKKKNAESIQKKAGIHNGGEDDTHHNSPCCVRDCYSVNALLNLLDSFPPDIDFNQAIQQTENKISGRANYLE